MRNVDLVFCNPVRYGGHVTFTAHLLRGLEENSVTVRLFTINTRTENFLRKFGYGLQYQNITIEDLVRRCNPILITAPSKPCASVVDKLIRNGARLVIHDPAEFKHGWDIDRARRNGAIIIRKSMLKHLPEAVLLSHPYKRLFDNNTPKKTKAGISISRIDFDKHTEILLDANRLLPKRYKIDIRGFENRIYTRFNILPKYPEWKQSVAAYPREIDAAVRLCTNVSFMFDMSVIKQDGGGTQYTFLEAMDAGSVCVLNQEWMMKGHTMKEGVNCLAVRSGQDISELIRKYYLGNLEETDEIIANGYKLLKNHDAKKVCALYAEELCGS